MPLHLEIPNLRWLAQVNISDFSGCPKIFERYGEFLRKPISEFLIRSYYEKVVQKRIDQILRNNDFDRSSERDILAELKRKCFA